MVSHQFETSFRIFQTMNSSNPLCEFVHFLNWIGLGISGLSLTLLNVDKLIFFRWPLSYGEYFLIFQLIGLDGLVSKISIH